VSKDDGQIDGQTQAWLASIEPDVRPRVLQETFPRILNQMAALWERPAQMDRYFADLLLDVRGNRHGFPLQVILELSALKEKLLDEGFSARAYYRPRPGSAT